MVKDEMLGLFDHGSAAVLAEEQQAQKEAEGLAAMDGFQADRLAAYQGANMLGKGLGKVAAVATGQDPRTTGEKKKDAFSAVQQALAASGAAPGSDAYWQLMISEFTKNGMTDAANAATTKWDAVKKDRAMTGYYDRGHQPVALKGKDALIAKLDGINEQLASDPDNPQLLGAQTNIASALERFYGVSQPKKASPWKTHPPAQYHEGYQENTEDGTVRDLPIPIKRIEKPEGNAAVTAVTIEDPNDPTKTIVVDARTMRKIGNGPKLSQVGTVNLKRQIQHAGTAAAIAQARQLLTGAGGGELPTESGFGNVVDTAASWVGVTPAGAKTADQLRVIGSALVRNVPRFEGPQSDKDLAHYKEAAGRIGDASIPIARRLAALDEVERILGEFEAGKKMGFFPGAVAGPAAPTGEARVKVTGPDGNPYTIPRSKLEAAKARGYVERK